MLNQVWEGRDVRYVSPESICQCWRKADIFPVTWKQDINNEVGRVSIAESQTVVSKEVSDEVCHLMNGINLKVNECSIDTSSSAGIKNIYICH